MDNYNNYTAQRNVISTNRGRNSSMEQNEAGPSTSTSYHARTPAADIDESEYEPSPIKRNRIARKLIQKMRHIIYEYSIKTGEQISGVFVEKPHAENRDFKIYGTKPLVNVMEDLKSSIDKKFQKSLDKEKRPTSYLVNSRSKLPPLTIDGVITKLEYFTQSQLRKLIPTLIKYTTGRHNTGWNEPSLKPEWWPDDLAWFNVRYDIRSAEQKKQEKWTNTLQRIIKSCYKYYGHEEMLYGQEFRTIPSIAPSIAQENSTNCNNASAPINQDFEEMEVIEPSVLVESIPTFQIMNESQVFQLTEDSPSLNNNVMYLLQTVGPSTGLLHPIRVVPVQTINLENTDSVNNRNDLMNCSKQTTNTMALTQRNDVEVINEACLFANSETSANVYNVQQ